MRELKTALRRHAKELPIFGVFARSRVREAHLSRDDLHTGAIAGKLEYHGERKLGARRVQRRVAGVADLQQQSVAVSIHPHRDAVADHPAISNQPFERSDQRPARTASAGCCA